MINLSHRFFVLCLCCICSTLLPLLAPVGHAQEATDNSVQEAAGNKQAANAGSQLFYLPETSGTAHGGVLIITDPGHHPETYNDIKVLRHSLANNHWHTLALDISDQPDEAVPQLIANGVAFLNKKGVFNIAVLGEGRSAPHAVRYVAAQPDSEEGKIHQIRALLLLNAENHIPSVEGDAIAPLAQISLPVLDAYLANDQQQQEQAAERRQLAKPRNPHYQQTRLPYANVQDSHQETRVTKRIRGWLDKNVAGFMVGGG